MPSIVIEVGKQRNGATFSLSPETRAMLADRKVPKPSASSLFVANEIDRGVFKRTFGPMSKQIVMILTGLPERQVDTMGFRFVNPGDSSVLLDSVA